MSETTTFPFSAIVGLENLKLALILNAINPKIGGVLVRGPKGSGKTTAVRALADVLPKIRTVKDCPFNCSPVDPSNMCEKCRMSYLKGGGLPVEEEEMRVVDLPLGATEDAVVGTLDVEKAIKSGIESFEPGILAQANQNILYIDEVNLLPDHIADDLLDAAATGWNVVEREGISVKHPSRFILVGTMNPEEGQIRPQLLDRFALSAEAQNVSSVKDRVEIVRKNMEFEADPEAFAKKSGGAQEELRVRIAKARENLKYVNISDKLIEITCAVCLELRVDGVRPDIVIAKTAKTLAAFEDKKDATAEHVMKAAELALGHRTREGGFLEPATIQEVRTAFSMPLKEGQPGFGQGTGRFVEKKKGKFDDKEPLPKSQKMGLLSPLGLRMRKWMEIEFGRAKKYEGLMPDHLQAGNGSADRGNLSVDAKPEKGGKHALLTEDSKWSTPKLRKGAAFLERMRESRFLPFKFFPNNRKPTRNVVKTVGKRVEAVTAVRRGRSFGWKMPRGSPSDIHFPATIRAASRRQQSGERSSEVALMIHAQDVREKLRVYKAPMTIMFVLDLSESMLEGIDSVREVMLKLHNDAYRYRDRVGLVAFKQMGAVVAQHPTTNLRLVANKLLRLRMSGLTPLAAGMLKGLEVLKEEKRRNNSTIRMLTIITDGDANVPLRKDPLTGETREFDPLDAAFYHYEEEARRDVISIAEMIEREGIQTVVINTSPKPPVKIDPLFFEEPVYTGSWMTGMIASATKGVQYEFQTRVTPRQKAVAEISDILVQAQDRYQRRRRMLFRGRAN